MYFSEAVVRPTFSSCSKHLPIAARQGALKIRGGSITAAKAATALGLAVGATTALSTNTVLDKYGGIQEDMDPMGVLTTRRIGGSILSFSIAAYCLVFQNSSPSTAVGLSCVPLFIEIFKALFDGVHKELGFPAEGQVVVGLSFVAFSYLFLNDSTSFLSKDTLLKIHSGWLLFHGVLIGCFPSLALKTYGGMDDASATSNKMVLQSVVSVWGFSLLSMGALSGFLATDIIVSTNKALAWSTLPFLFRFLSSKFV